MSDTEPLDTILKRYRADTGCDFIVDPAKGRRFAVWRLFDLLAGNGVNTATIRAIEIVLSGVGTGDAGAGAAEFTDEFQAYLDAFDGDVYKSGP